MMVVFSLWEAALGSVTANCFSKTRSRRFGKARTRTGASTEHAAEAERSDPVSPVMLYESLPLHGTVGGHLEISEI